MNAARTFMIEFLLALEAAMPAPNGCTHSVSVGHAQGAVHLILWVAISKDHSRPVFIHGGDFDKPIDQLVRECLAVLAGTPQQA